jgi:CcmD family protein
MKSYAFLFWAYNVVWLLLAGYLLYLFLKLRKLERRLRSVERGARDVAD